jgi:predicted CXXCH cytochrome family protein
VNTVDEAGRVTDEGGLNKPLVDARRFTVYRVRFQLVNDGDDAVTIDPALQLAGDGWSTVPAVDPKAGKAFYAASDDGRTFRERRTEIPVAGLRLDAAGDAAPVQGLSSAGENPLAGVRLPAHSFTEIEFAIRATMDAAWTGSYELRLVSDGRELAGAARVGITMGAKPEVELSPGQKNGRGVKDPVPLYALDPTIGWTDLPTPTAMGTGHTATYALRGPIAAGGPYTTPHTNYTLATDACASCHSSHTAPSTMLLREPAPQATLCFTCHDGSGALSDVQSDWSSPSLPANDPATSSWYSHPSTDASAADHVSDKENEFGGALERHAACADCHQPHHADATKPVNTVAGWTASGAIKGASGVSVVNGAARTAPTYTLNTSSAFEYELCFKCHSGFTQLPAQDPARPSRWALDKAIELNPANLSYHPVEAAGKNQTNAMALSLAGTSPYKLWNFETNETVRCLNCHGDSAVASPASPPPADSRLDNHAGPNRGMLIANYKDRVLKPRGQLYLAQDFALCYTCHAEEPMVDDSGDVRYDTNFNFHGYHLTNLGYNGSGGVDIDTLGAGQGNATCAECHFRTHGTALATGGQEPEKGLVNFAPNVRPLNGTLSFVPATSSTLGTCTMTCHGKPHDRYVYLAAP